MHRFLDVAMLVGAAAAQQALATTDMPAYDNDFIDEADEGHMNQLFDPRAPGQGAHRSSHFANPYFQLPIGFGDGDAAEGDRLHHDVVD